MSEARRLADRIETENYEAAAALRRLDAECEQLRADKAEMVAALKLLDEAFCSDDYGTREGRNKGRAALIAARAAIAKETK